MTNPLYELRERLASYLETLVDKGTHIDRGFGGTVADLHPVISGVEYHIQISIPETTSDPADPDTWRNGGPRL